MHEMSLMAGIFDLIHQNLANHPVTKVTKVKLKVGALTNVVPEALELAFAAFARDTVVQGAQLEIERVPLVIRCQSCGQETFPGEWVFRCSHCNSARVEITGGRELYLDCLEVETDGD